MFQKDQLDENGEIPSPMREEKFNFNPHDVTGTFDRDDRGNPQLNTTDGNTYTDNYGKKVNKHGRLIDEEGNILNKYNRIALDERQLTEGDIPPMLNYEGKKYKIDDVIGEFDKDPRCDIMVLQDKKGNLVDKKSKPVNKKGYLIDKKGNIVD